MILGGVSSRGLKQFTDQLPQSMSSVDKERPVAVICRTGMRSRRAARILREHSVDAAIVTGGMRAWMRAG